MTLRQYRHEMSEREFKRNVSLDQVMGKAGFIPLVWSTNGGPRFLSSFHVIHLDTVYGLT